MQKTARTQCDVTPGASVRPAVSWRHGQGIPDRGKIADHAQMDLPEHITPERNVQFFQGLARRLHVQEVAGFQRAVDGLSAALLDTFGGAANILQRPEKAQIGGVGHRIGLSQKKTASFYRGRP